VSVWSGVIPPPPTHLFTTPGGVDLEILRTGSGEPVTVFAHGLGSSIIEARPLASGVGGTKVFYSARGHGRSAAPAGRWTYRDLARDLAAVADHAGATQALGISLGAGALANQLAERPDRYRKVVFYLPAVLDQPRGAAAQARFAALLAALRTGEPEQLAAVVALDVPEPIRSTPAAAVFIRGRSEQLRRDGLAEALAGIPAQAAIGRLDQLAAVTAEALVLGAEGDELHPADIARQLAGVLPRAQLHIYPGPGLLWTHRADLRDRISGFLNRPTE
jgi:pimeloyl-ACP methyl ester carboxylesterase